VPKNPGAPFAASLSARAKEAILAGDRAGALALPDGLRRPEEARDRLEPTIAQALVAIAAGGTARSDEIHAHVEAFQETRRPPADRGVAGRASVRCRGPGGHHLGYRPAAREHRKQSQQVVQATAGNGSLIASWINLHAGYPPFVLSVDNALTYFASSAEIKQFADKSTWRGRRRLPKYRKSFRAFWGATCRSQIRSSKVTSPGLTALNSDRRRVVIEE
jgi:hypothetical protein